MKCQCLFSGDFSFFFFKMLSAENFTQSAKRQVHNSLVLSCGLFVLRFYGPGNPIGHVERGQFT